MKRAKLLLVVAVLFVTTGVSAQILRSEDLEAYAVKQYGQKWEDAATQLSSTITLDKNNGLTYVQVINAEGKTKDQLYVLLNYWFTSTFNDENCKIALNDKELGTIIAQDFMKNIAEQTGTTNQYFVSIKPIIKCDIKDEKVRVTYTVPYYSVVKIQGGGIINISDNDKPTPVDETWTLDKCFPFATKDVHKKTSSKALIMSYAYSNVILDKIQDCITNGLVGNENDDW